MPIKFKKALAVATAGCLALTLCVGLAGCGETTEEDKWEKAIAATIDGRINITEKEVNDYVAKYRAYAGYSDDASWASYLVTTQMTTADVRANAIAQVAQNKIVQEFADKDGITIEDDYIADYITNIKSSYGVDEEDPDAWTEFLEGMGYTEETYIETVREGMLLEEVENAEVPAPEPTTDQLSAYANANPSSWMGKNSYTFRFAYGEEASDDAKTAAYNAASQLIDQIQSQNMGLEELKALGEELYANETVQYAGEAGFDCRQEFSAEYQAALDTLSPGLLYATPVDSEYGYHVIFCSEQFEPGPDGKLNVNNMPESLYTALVNEVTQQLWEQAKSEWLQQQISNADIKVNKCPEGLPYDVDLSLAESANEGDTSTESAEVTAGSEASASAEAAAVEESGEAASAESASAESASAESAEAENAEQAEDAQVAAAEGENAGSAEAATASNTTSE